MSTVNIVGIGAGPGSNYHGGLQELLLKVLKPLLEAPLVQGPLVELLVEFLALLLQLQALVETSS